MSYKRFLAVIPGFAKSVKITVVGFSYVAYLFVLANFPVSEAVSEAGMPSDRLHKEGTDE